MSNSGFELRHCKVGDRLPLWQGEPFSRAALALFAGASGDHNPLHIDSDYAQAAGMYGHCQSGGTDRNRSVACDGFERLQPAWRAKVNRRGAGNIAVYVNVQNTALLMPDAWPVICIICQ